MTVGSSAANRTVGVGLLAVALAFTAIWAKRYFFPSDEDVIRRNLAQIASELSRDKSENPVASASKILGTLERFALPLSVSVLAGGQTHQQTLDMKDKAELKESITSVKFRYPVLKVKWQDLSVSVAEDRQTAESSGRVRVEFSEDSEQTVYDLYDVQLKWTKGDKGWLISLVSLVQVEGE